MDGSVVKLLLLILGCILDIHKTEAKSCDEVDSKWFLPFAEGDNVQKLTKTFDYSTSTPFTAFGARQAEGWMVKVLKGTGSGSIQVSSVKGDDKPGTFTIRASNMEYADGLVYMRMSENEQDLNAVARNINEAYPCLKDGKFTPSVVFVATYVCMLHEEDAETDTFQVAIAADGHRMYVILQYHELHDRSDKEFGLMHHKHKTNYNLTEWRKDHIDVLLGSTNGVRVGVWVYDVTQEIPATPELCLKTGRECTMSHFGMVQSFDGYHQVARPKHTTVIAQTSGLERENSCNFMARVVMDVNGEVDYVDFKAGGQSKDKKVYTFTFDRREGILQNKGPSVPKTTAVTDFPWNLPNSDVIITGAYEQRGWVLSNDVCGYQMEFDPTAEDPHFRLTISGTQYDRPVDGEAILDGFCGDKDSDDENDESIDKL